MTLQHKEIHSVRLEDHLSQDRILSTRGVDGLEEAIAILRANLRKWKNIMQEMNPLLRVDLKYSHNYLPTIFLSNLPSVVPRADIPDL